MLSCLLVGRCGADEVIHPVGETLAGSAINGWVDTSVTWSVAAVPEPGTVALLVAGAAALACAVRFRSRRTR